MADRKIYCEILEGVTFSDRCLFKLSKIIEGNKTCENCILRQLERLKREKVGRSGVNDIKDIKSIKDTNVINDTNVTNDTSKRRRRTKSRPKARPGSTIEKQGDTKQTYSIQLLSKLLGKSRRTIQEWAQRGKIPAQKIGGDWNLAKKEIDEWLSEKGKPSLQCIDNVNTSGGPSRGQDLRTLNQNDGGSSVTEGLEAKKEGDGFV